MRVMHGSQPRIKPGSAPRSLSCRSHNAASYAAVMRTPVGKQMEVTWIGQSQAAAIAKLSPCSGHARSQSCSCNAAVMQAAAPAAGRWVAGVMQPRKTKGWRGVPKPSCHIAVTMSRSTAVCYQGTATRAKLHDVFYHADASKRAKR